MVASNLDIITRGPASCDKELDVLLVMGESIKREIFASIIIYKIFTVMKGFCGHK